MDAGGMKYLWWGLVQSERQNDKGVKAAATQTAQNIPVLCHCWASSCVLNIKLEAVRAKEAKKRWGPN
jgi:hypothetical protein